MEYKTRRKVTGYGTVQTAVLQLPISQKSKLVYCLLASYTGKSENCFPSLSTICNDLQMGRTTVTEALKELQAVDLVDVERRPNEKGYFDSNLYYVHEIEPCTDSEQGNTDLLNKVKKANDYKSISKKTTRVRKMNTDNTKLGGSPESVPPLGVVPIQDGGSPHSVPGVVLGQDCNNTISNITIEQPLIFPPNGENIKEPPADLEGKPVPKKRKKKDTPTDGAPPPLTQVLHQPFIDEYHNWFKQYNGVPPQLQKKDFPAVPRLITALKNAVVAAAEKENRHILPDDLPGEVLKAWKYIFQKWDKLDAFLRGKTDLAQIGTNFNNIITQIKNGHTKTGRASGTTENRTLGEIAHAVGEAYDRRFAKHG